MCYQAPFGRQIPNTALKVLPLVARTGLRCGRWPRSKLLAQDHQPIILLPDDPAIYIFAPCGQYLHRLNTSLDNLFQTILYYAEMVELAVASDSSAFTESRMPTRLAKEFELKFCKREPTIPDSIWVYWANERCTNTQLALPVGQHS